MSTTASFTTMLNDYLTNELLKEELIGRTYVLQKVEKDNGWKLGNLPVPFKGATASSIAYGSLTDSTDMAQDKYVRGVVSSYKEAWATIYFNEADLQMQDGKIPEKTFLRLLPDSVDDFMDFFKQQISTSFLNGPHIVSLIAPVTGATDSYSAGLVTVDHPERLMIGQKLYWKGTTAALSSATYIGSINTNTQQIQLWTTRAGSTGADVSAQSVADVGRGYAEGGATNGFSSLKKALLAASNTGVSGAGDTTLYGQTKTAYPYLQAVNVDLSGANASNFLDKVFDGYVKVRQLGRGGNANQILMSYKNLGTVLKQLEAAKGPYNIKQGSESTNPYGWTEIVIGSVKGMLTIVGLQECDDDFIIYMDWSAVKFFSNGFFRKRTNPDGRQYFETRATTGYQYIIDLCLFGELVVVAPTKCGIGCNISY